MDPKVQSLGHLESSLLVVAQDRSPHANDLPSEAIVTPAGWSGMSHVVAPIWTKVSWTNAAVASHGHVKSAAVPIVCLRPRTVFFRALLAITSAAHGTRDLKISLGVIPPPFNDYVDKADGQIVGVTRDRKTAQSDVLSLTDHTDLTLVFETKDSLADVIGSAGDVFVETIVLP